VGEVFARQHLAQVVDHIGIAMKIGERHMGFLLLSCPWRVCSRVDLNFRVRTVPSLKGLGSTSRFTQHSACGSVLG
jgi:hypothetical protein